MEPKLLGEIAKDRWWYAAVSAYAVAVCALAVTAGRADGFQPWLYAGQWATWVAVAAGLMTGATMTPALWSKNPSLALRRKLKQLGQPQAVAFGLSAVALLFVQGLFSSAKMLLPRMAPYAMDPLLARIDNALFLGHDPWTLLTWLDPYTTVIQLLYMPGWLAVYAAMAYAALTSPGRLRAQYLWSLLLVLVVLGNALALAGLSGGPIFYDKLVGGDRFAGLTANLALHDGWYSSWTMSGFLWRAYAEDWVQVGGGISAFPSIHVATVTLFTLFAWRRGRLFGWIMASFAAFVFVASIHLGWHYAIDGIAGALGAIVIWRVAADIVSRYTPWLASSSEADLEGAR